MENIIRKIRNEMISRDITQRDVAKVLEVSSSMVTQYFQGKSPLDFEKFLKIVHLVFRKNYEDLILEFCKYTKDKMSIREALEWSLHRWCPELSKSIYEEERKNETSVSKLYLLLLQSRNGEINPEKFFASIQRFRLNKKLNTLLNDEENENKKDTKKDQVEVDETAQVFVIYSLCLMYHYCHKQRYNMIPGVAELTFVYLEKIKSGFLRKAHTLSIKEMLAVTYLYSKNEKSAEPILKEMGEPEVKEYFPLMYLSKLALISEFNMFTDYNKSIKAIKRALDQLKEWNLNDYVRRRMHLESIHDFVKITNGNLEGLYLTDPDQTLHYLSVKRYPVAEEIFEKLEKRGKLTSLQQYCKALYFNDILLMRKSEVQFVQENNIHLWTLPRRYIDIYLKSFNEQSG